MKFVLRPAARRDVLRQFEYYVEKDAKAASQRFIPAVEAAIALACKHPSSGAPRLLRNERLNGLRSLPVKGFPEIRVYYLVSPGMVRVIRVLHGKRDVDRILEEEQ